MSSTKFRPSGWPDSSHSPSSSSSTSASLSSSFSSDSATSEMHDSLSDFTQSDHSASSSLPAPFPRPGRVHDLALAAPRPRSSSLAVAMGQSYSKPSPPPSAPANLAQKGIALTAGVTNTGLKLKRAFANRRKKSEDATKLFAGRAHAEEKEWTTVVAPPQATSSASVAAPVEVNAPPSRHPKGGKLTLQLAAHALRGNKEQQKDPLPSPLPPPPPPKPASMQPSKAPGPPPSSIHSTTLAKPDIRGSIIPISPGISSAVNFMISNEGQERVTQVRAQEVAEPSDDEEKDIWRKSDSTMSHHTIRPGAGASNRSSRPVSMAESMSSNHTVVPSNKRLSQLVVDSELDTPEEDDSSFKSASEELPPIPAPSDTVKNRRSMSLNLGSITPKFNLPNPPASSAGTLVEGKSISKSQSENHSILAPSTSANETPTLTRAAASGIMSQSQNGTPSAGVNIRGRLAALTSGTSRPERNRTPPSAYSRNTPSPQPQPQPQPQLQHSRAAAISISGFGPAAGLAKRAVEKMGRAWGGFSSSSSGSVYSSSSSSTGHSSDHALARTNSNTSNSAMASGKGKNRRTPEAPSGAWSLASSGGASSESDVFMPAPSGPLLGHCIRRPQRVGMIGEVASGVVFGRELRTVVRETAVGVRVNEHDAQGEPHGREGDVDPTILKALEARALPALIVRCAQHILIWGVHEEGLFRVSGRPSHVTKLRNEFDSGADYDMRSCSPGDLDPHAVSSVFKAFLRELPEPILTHSLIPYFEAALAQEKETISREQPTQPRAARGPTLPSNPKSGVQGLRKPPSLSTLAMPNFNGMKPPSRSLCNAFKSLIAQLPQENKDLIRTVTDLIKATAKESRQTKMPLSNLLLVFCPSLNMNPPLLRVLCEAEDIWEGPPIESPILDIKRESVVLDIGPSAMDSNVDDHDKEGEQADKPADIQEHDLETSSPPSIASGPPSQERPSTAENKGPRARPLGPRRAHVPPISVENDALSGTSDSSVESKESSSVIRSSFESATAQDDVISYTSTSESLTSPSSGGFMASSPPFTSSVESLDTPLSSSASPSLQDLHTVSQQCKAVEGPGPAVEIADEEDILTPRRTITNDSVQFPTTSSVPSTPMSPRTFIPSLSLPGLSSQKSPISPTNSAPASPRNRRSKKPSLHLLFSKRSASQLSTNSGGIPYISSPYLQAPRAASDSSVSTPSSTMTAPQSSTFTLPPVLDTPIESSPLRFGLGFDPKSPPISPPHTDTNLPDKDSQPVISTPPEPTHAPGETPIASQYCGSSSTAPVSASPEISVSHLRPQPTLRSRQASKTSLASTSSNHLGLLGSEEEDNEDWTQSVLLAAGAEGSWDFASYSR